MTIFISVKSWQVHAHTHTYVCTSAKSSYITRYSSKTKVGDAACLLFYSSKIFVLDVFSSFLNSFGVVMFCGLEEVFKVKRYLLFYSFVYYWSR